MQGEARVYSIAEILQLPIGNQFGGIEKTVKTAKKSVQVGKNWVQSVVLTDSTGDILADINCGNKYLPIVKGSLIRIIVTTVQSAESGKKLYVSEWTQPSQTADEHYSLEEEIEAGIIRSKIKCLLVSAKVRTGVDMEQLKQFASDPSLKEIIDEIVKG
jgi:hypothetical protein